jgi:hypothetical protein
MGNQNSGIKGKGHSLVPTSDQGSYEPPTLSAVDGQPSGNNNARSNSSSSSSSSSRNNNVPPAMASANLARVDSKINKTRQNARAIKQEKLVKYGRYAHGEVHSNVRSDDKLHKRNQLLSAREDQEDTTLGLQGFADQNARKARLEEQRRQQQQQRVVNPHQNNPGNTAREARAQASLARMTGKGVGGKKSKVDRKYDNMRTYDRIQQGQPSSARQPVETNKQQQDTPADIQAAANFIAVADPARVEALVLNYSLLQASSVAQESLVLIGKIITKMVSHHEAGHVDDPKYRKIKMSNAKIRKLLLDPPGGAEILQVLGFEQTSFPGDSPTGLEDFLFYSTDKQGGMSFPKAALELLASI